MGDDDRSWDLCVPDITPARRPALEAEARRLEQLGLRCNRCVAERFTVIAAQKALSYATPADDEGLLAVV